MENSVIDKIVLQIASTKKYSDLSYETIENIVVRIAQKYTKEKETLSKSKNLLHRMWGAYYTSFPDFKKLALKHNNGDVSLEQIVKLHFSTLERSIISNEFYKELFSGKESLSIADFGCGLHPLMILLNTFHKHILLYDAYDIHRGEVAFLNEIFKDKKVENFHAYENDLMLSVPNKKYDIVLLLNLIPVLEMIEKDCTQKILSLINAKKIIVSFPTSTLKTRKNYLGNHYESEFTKKLTAWNLPFTIKIYETEVVFTISKP